MESIVSTTAINVAKKKELIFRPALSLIWRRITGRVFVAVRSPSIVAIQFAPLVGMNVLLNKAVIKMENEAYKALIEIRHIIRNAEVFVKRDMQLPPAMISELDRLGDLGKIVEAYAVAAKDKDIISEIEKIPRFSLHRINSKDTTSPKTRYSIAICIRSLYNVAQIGNQDNENTTQEEKTIPKEFDTEDAKKLFKRAIDAGFMDENYKFIGTWYQATYFAERAAESLKLKYKWKPFQTLWNYDKLAQVKREIKERFGVVHAQKEIDKIFDL